MRDEDAGEPGEVEVVPRTAISRGLARLRGNAPLCRPDEDEFYGALEVVDVELATEVVPVQLALSGFNTPPEGVYAVLWADRTPVGDLTIHGDPSRLVPRLAKLAARHA